MGEADGQKVSHMPPTCRRMVAAVERETLACGRVGYLIPEIFPLVGRSG